MLFLVDVSNLKHWEDVKSDMNGVCTMDWNLDS